MTQLPYGPVVTRLLPGLRRGFQVVNRVSGPAVKRGFGPLLLTPVSGQMLVLRTIGRLSGQVREAPVGYTLVDGRVVVMAGYGRSTHWFRNAIAHPEVEIALPGAVLAGRAAEITDRERRRKAFRVLYDALGVVGRTFLPEAASASDERIDELAEALPILEITPTAVLPGPYDPGGSFWRYPLAATLAGCLLLTARRRPSRTRGSTR
jgi:deazaflavin-dependent oxidoreductase (nitroreductase family)